MQKLSECSLAGSVRKVYMGEIVVTLAAIKRHDEGKLVECGNKRGDTFIHPCVDLNRNLGMRHLAMLFGNWLPVHESLALSALYG